MSRSGYSSRKKVFLTQDDASVNEATRAKLTPELVNPTQELSNLKKKYDTVKQENIKKAIYLEWLEGKVIEIKSTAASIKADMDQDKDKNESLLLEIDKASAQLNQELELKKIYEHMLFRNKNEGTQLDIKVNKFSENVKTAKLRLDLENEKARKSKDQKYSAKAMMRDLKTTLELDTQKQISHISNLEANINYRKEMLQRLNERTKRQAEIVELAARHDRESHEKSIREQITANKLLYNILIEKEISHKKAGSEVEAAFQDIKTKTGLTDPRVILSRFTTREETHNQLIESVEKSEGSLEELRKQYYGLRDQLKELMLIANAEYVPENTEEYQEKILEAENNLEKVRVQERKIALVYKDVSKWSKKICEKLGVRHNGELEASVIGIAERLDSIMNTVREDKEKFIRNLKIYEKKKTNEIVREIYRETHSPIKLS